MFKARPNLIRLAIPLLLLALFLRGCVIRPADTQHGSSFNKGRNAAWIGIEWVNEPHSEAAIAALADDLNRRQIVYAFLYVSYMRSSGEFGATYKYASDTIAAMRKAQPNIKILAWYGLPFQYVDLSKQAVRDKITAFSADLIALGFDGVHLDPEPINNNDQNVLALLEETRQAIGDAPILSIAARTIWPVFPDTLAPAVPIMWSGQYYRDVAERVDQIAVMTYDSTLPLPVLYRVWSRFQVIQISKAINGLNVELLMGIPTSEEETLTHRAFAENMNSGLQGIIDGLNDDESLPDLVTGVAIYPYWETSAEEWSTYENLWLKAP